MSTAHEPLRPHDLRASKRLPRDEARSLLALLQASPARIDRQVDTGHGGFALAKWAGHADPGLLKTGRGPLLVPDPWVDDAS